MEKLSKSKRERRVENLICPAKNWDEQFRAYGCIVDGRVCIYGSRERCDTYKYEVLPRRREVMDVR